MMEHPAAVLFIAAFAVLLLVALAGAIIWPMVTSRRQAETFSVASSRQQIRTVRSASSPRRPATPIRTLRAVTQPRQHEARILSFPSRRGSPAGLTAECGWCGTPVSLGNGGDGSTVVCQVAGCHGVSCRSCHDRYHHCPGRCGVA